MNLTRETYNLVAFVAASTSGSGLEGKSPGELQKLLEDITGAGGVDEIFPILGEDAAHILNNYILVWAAAGEEPGRQAAAEAELDQAAVDHVRDLFLQNRISWGEADTLLRSQGVDGPRISDILAHWMAMPRAPEAPDEPPAVEPMELVGPPDSIEEVLSDYVEGRIDTERARARLLGLGIDNAGITARIHEWDEVIAEERVNAAARTADQAEPPE